VSDKIRIMHVLHRFAMGGMENGMVNLINHLPSDEFEHLIVSLTDVSGFSKRIIDPSVRVVALNHSGGTPFKLLLPVLKLMSDFRPHVCHTRNVGTIEVQAMAWLARVPLRIHGEHGWDVGDLKNGNSRLVFLRRLLKYFIHCQVALSSYTERFLIDRVGVASGRVVQISNGVDTKKFFPESRVSGSSGPVPSKEFVIGGMGRIAQVKNFPLLLKGFAAASKISPLFAKTCRLKIYGDGDSAGLQQLAINLGIETSFCHYPATDHVRDALVSFDVLVVPSLMEGLSNAILEAQSSGIPVVASRVGGNPDLVTHDMTGFLFESQDSEELGRLLVSCFSDPIRLNRVSQAGMNKVRSELSIDVMCDNYARLYRVDKVRSASNLLEEK
jgi:sugar transferase (PEP-CTERM/EpsH1 system associated)